LTTKNTEPVSLIRITFPDHTLRNVFIVNVIKEPTVWYLLRWCHHHSINIENLKERTTTLSDPVQKLHKFSPSKNDNFLTTRSRRILSLLPSSFMFGFMTFNRFQHGRLDNWSLSLIQRNQMLLLSITI
jgi:hypothetical protein